jgi:membrane protein YqaA with SNARE-associated domain
MDLDFVQVALDHGAYVSVAVISLVSAVFPIINAELAVVGLAAAVPNTNVFLLVSIATAAQMAGKSAMYWLGRKGTSVASTRYAAAIERWGHRFRGSRKSVGTLMFVSSASGLPPFYLVSTLAGAFRTSFLAFFALGFAGRFIRFAVLGLSPAAVKSIAG